MNHFVPGEKLWRFHCDADDALYQDHLGRAVVADAEGPGFFRVIEGDVEIEVDEVLSDLREGAFRESFSARRRGGTNASACKIEVALGRTEPVNPVFWRVPPDVDEFCGWLLPVDGWTMAEPVATLEALGEDRIGAPADVRVVSADAFFLRNDEAREAHQWQARNASAFHDIEPFPAPFMSHLNEAQFTMELPPENVGAHLARIYDAFHGRQRCRVFVDDVLAGIWYTPWEDREERVQADYFGLPASLTAGKSSIRITLDPPAGSPLWSAAWYGLDALLPRIH